MADIKDAVLADDIFSSDDPWFFIISLNILIIMQQLLLLFVGKWSMRSYNFYKWTNVDIYF